MEFLKKNVMWVALIGAVLGAWAIYELKFKKEATETTVAEKGGAVNGFGGKLDVSNPISK